MPRIGLVGFGYWGPNLARNLSEIHGVILAGIADTHPARREAAAKKYPGVQLVADAGGRIGLAGLDAVVVATPVSTHFEVALAALKAGKDVLVEKPLAAGQVEAKTLVDVAEREGRILMVNHTYVYSGAVRKIAELIEAGELGEIYYYDSIRINLGLFQSDVSVVWDLAAHDVSLIQFLLHRRFLTVQATGACHFGTPLENVAHVTLGLEGGIQAHINVSWIAPMKTRQTIIVGDRKMLLYDDLEPDEKIQVYDQGGPVAPARGRAGGARGGERARGRPALAAGRRQAGDGMTWQRIAPDVELGPDVALGDFVNLYGCRIGEKTRVGPFVEIQKNAVIGRRCKISSHSFICEGVTIEDEVFVGHGGIFTNDRS